ncbi:hypothetical protein MMC25_003467 [Agyrium rufum]|nr:hypothetical protein [Agyrium rufum]
MARFAFSRQPSPYPSILFHTIRLSQLVSSILVCGFLSYFIHNLALEPIKVPWTFAVPLTVSCLTILSYFLTIFFYHQRTLKPLHSAYINGSLLLLWIVAFALQMYNLHGTLTHRCTIGNWGTDLGVHVCRIYKALAAFTTTALLSSIAALLLDLFINYVTFSHGAYNSMRDPPRSHSRSASAKTSKKGSIIFQGNQFDVFKDIGIEFPEYTHKHSQSHMPHSREDNDNPDDHVDNDLEEEQQRAAAGMYRDAGLMGSSQGGGGGGGGTSTRGVSYTLRQPIGVQSFGYAAPTEQTSYDGHKADEVDIGAMGHRGHGDY